MAVVLWRTLVMLRRYLGIAVGVLMLIWFPGCAANVRFYMITANLAAEIDVLSSPVPRPRSQAELRSPGKLIRWHYHDSIAGDGAALITAPNARRAVRPDGPEIALPEPDLNPLVALATSLMASQGYPAVMLSC